MTTKLAPAAIMPLSSETIAAVVQVNGEEIGRGRFYLMEGEAPEDEIA